MAIIYTIFYINNLFCCGGSSVDGLVFGMLLLEKANNILWPLY